MDINCDLGEGMNNDAQIMPHISRCNIACGGHAGDAEIMNRSIDFALEHGVAIGAHPSYPDRYNFGRKSMDMAPEVLKNTLITQIHELSRFARQHGTQLSHVKPHGALYHDLASNSELGRIFLDAVAEVLGETVIITAPYSVLFKAPPQGQKHTLWSEGFIDRGYHSDLRLVSRGQEGAIIDNPDHAYQQFLSLCNGQINSVEGQTIPILVNTCCLHSDHPNALSIAQRIGQNSGNYEV